MLQSSKLRCPVESENTIAVYAHPDEALCFSMFVIR